MFAFFLHFKLSISRLFGCIKLLLHTLFFIYLIPSNILALESNNLEDTSLNLLGIAIHSELRNDIYIGAMFAPPPIDNYKRLYDPSITKNMSLRFLQAYSQRKVARLWKQRIAMNNPKSVWQPLTKDIVRFAKIFNRPMESGDEINLIYIPNAGTKIYLNGSLFLIIQNPQFYTSLLNIWYGNIPPSKLFKTGITGNNTDYLQKQMIKQYESLVSIPGRFDQDKPKTASTKRDKTNKRNQENQEKVTINPIKKTAVSAKSQNLSTQVLVDAFKPDLKQITTKKNKDTNIANKKALFKLDIKLADSTVKDSSIKQIDLVDEPLVVSDTLTNTNNFQPPAESDDFIDNDLVNGSYARELVDIVKRHQRYPRKALQKEHEGDLIISLTISSLGKIINLSVVQGSGSRYLDKGVLRQVRAIEPFPPIPASLNLESYNVEIPMSFSLSK